MAADEKTSTTDEETVSSIPAPRQLPVPPGVLVLGAVAGSIVTLLAVTHGIRFPGLEIVLSVLVSWLLLMAAGVTTTELLRRHHRALRRHGWRHTKRGARFARHHTGRGAKYLTAKAAERWQARQPPPVQVRRASDRAPQAREDIPDPSAPPLNGKTVAAIKAKVCEMYADDDVEPFELTVNGDGSVTIDRQWAEGHIVAWWRYEDTTTEPPASTHADGPPPSPPEGKNTMPDTRVVSNGQGQRGGSRRSTHSQTSGTVPAKWTPVISDASGFEPENDGDLLDWIGNEVNGVHAYASALIEAYETCTNGIGLDPVATAALHDVADTITEAAIALARTRAKFAEHYELPREFAGNGGLMPHDGRWVTGDGDA